MSVKVALFGTSRSGKDYTIRDATEILAEKGMLFTHVSPISMVHEELEGRKLRDMEENEKESLVAKVRSRIESMLLDEYVFVDEHYCFPETFNGVKIDNGYYGEKLPYHTEKDSDGRVYETVFQSDWLKYYDMVVYMDIDPTVILDRFHSSEGEKNNPFATYEDVRLWQLFEIEHVGDLCRNWGIPLYYIYDHQKTGEELATVVTYSLKAGHKTNNTKNEN